jgi:hypothetical protein
VYYYIKADPLHAMKTPGGRGGIAPTSALNGGEQSASRPGRALPRGKDPGTHWTYYYILLLNDILMKYRQSVSWSQTEGAEENEGEVMRHSPWRNLQSVASICFLFCSMLDVASIREC